MARYILEIIGDDDVGKAMNQLITGVLELDGVESISISKSDTYGTPNPIEKSSIKDRRKKVLNLAKKGKTNAQIADELDLSRSTVYNDTVALRKEGNDI